ncbi:hypothetical protein CVT26_006165 [Gymnopilus dilepis]|uniref:Uncharacterized protein n=1 Tax=Gymnopilus dilepis TaxID=231916 RepID=A0A409WR97_9AGAR|nr:hypothetical protein CVT26_006165 [Gymnopilus dilepis]
MVIRRRDEPHYPKDSKEKGKRKREQSPIDASPTTPTLDSGVVNSEVVGPQSKRIRSVDNIAASQQEAKDFPDQESTRFVPCLSSSVVLPDVGFSTSKDKGKGRDRNSEQEDRDGTIVEPSPHAWRGQEEEDRDLRYGVSLLPFNGPPHQRRRLAVARSLQERGRSHAEVNGESSRTPSHAPSTPPPASSSDVPLTPHRSSSNGSVPSTPSSSSRRTFAAARQQLTGVQSRPITSARAAEDPNEYRVRNALAFINFVAADHFLNPARASPMLTRAVRTGVNGFRMNLYVDNQPAILLSSIFVRQSHLLSPPPRGLRQHLIAGIGHTQEWERQVSFICMAFGRPELRAQLSADVLTYATRSDTSQAHTSASSSFSATQSPSIRMSSRNYVSSASNGMSLAYDDPVPVYDAREVAVDLSNVESLFSLPRFAGEVPVGSFAVVGYTTNAYLSNRDGAWHVSCNVRFVVVVGTPADPVPEEDPGVEDLPGEGGN